MGRRRQRAGACGGPRGTRRGGMILVVVLLIISLLAILGASFSYRMNAELAAVRAKQDLQQAELAARSGIERAVWVLRDKRTDMDEWYSSQKWFRRIPVWMPDKIGGSESLADQEAIPGQPAWRFSVVSYKIVGDTAQIRYGVNDEAGKINLNVATRSQLLKLFEQLKPEDVTPFQLADALIDWRDKDDEPNSSDGAESSYYDTLEPKYKAKNRPLDTIEELLMVKGFNGRILYGEDYNRNGYLDANEDDGPDGSFPPDNGDGELERGLLPLVTVYSWDWNTGNDNKRRVSINFEKFDKPEDLPSYIVDELGQETIQFIAEAQKRRYRFRSVGDLLGLEVYQDGTSNHDAMWRNFSRRMRQENRVRENTEEGDGNPATPDENEGGTAGAGSGQDQNSAGNAGQSAGEEGNGAGEENTGGRRRTASDRNQESRDRREQGNQADDEDSNAQEKENSRRNQSIRSGSERGSSRRGGTQEDAAPGAGDQNGGDQSDGESGTRRGSRRGSRRGGQDDSRAGGDQEANGEGETGDNQQNNNEGRRSGRRRGRDNAGGAEETGGTGQSGGGAGRGTPVRSPVQPQEMVVLTNRLTVLPVPAVSGLINVNTAPAAVLRTIPGLEPEQADAIVAKRDQVAGPDKQTPGWLVSTGAVDANTFALISNQVTTRSIQFTLDVIGFADHVGTFKRVQAVVEMKGQVSQLKYFRDITSLGMGYPVRDDERSEGFAFSDR